MGRKSHNDVRVAMVSYCFSRTICTEANLIEPILFRGFWWIFTHKLCHWALPSFARLNNFNFFGFPLDFFDQSMTGFCSGFPLLSKTEKIKGFEEGEPEKFVFLWQWSKYVVVSLGKLISFEPWMAIKRLKDMWKINTLFSFSESFSP